MKCYLCSTENSESILQMENYPLNSIYCAERTMNNQYRKNMNLYHCRSCGHFYAFSEVDINDLYNNDYLYSPSSPNVQERANFIDKELKKYSGIKFNRVIDIGCNDTTLLKKISKSIQANYYIGIDPAIPNAIVESPDTFILYKDFVQNIIIPHFDPNLPDLVISDQTFEHIPNLNEVVELIWQQTSNSSIISICVPSFEALMLKMNYNFVIHEHLHYFTLGRLVNLLESHGFSLKQHYIDYQTTSNFLFTVFKKEDKQIISDFNRLLHGLIDFDNSFFLFKKSIDLYKNVMKCVNKNELTFGFGASDLTGNLAYFIDTDFDGFNCILDDTESKQNKYIPFIVPNIIAPKNEDYTTCNVVITAPQASRAIMNRLKEMKFKRIINPLGITY